MWRPDVSGDAADHVAREPIHRGDHVDEPSMRARAPDVVVGVDHVHTHRAVEVRTCNLREGRLHVGHASHSLAREVAAEVVSKGAVRDETDEAPGVLLVVLVVPEGGRPSHGLTVGDEARRGDEDQARVAAEVEVRGPNVFRGYWNDAESSRASRDSEGWFRTGDQGVMDDEGYLQITGRLKEIINRGGEKISPREVDDVLMDHPAVQQVVTFAVPDKKLGEEVAAAVVLREGSDATEQELRKFAGTRLANFKVPRKVLFLEEIPKGATGKLQRIGLAKKLGLTE